MKHLSSHVASQISKWNTNHEETFSSRTTALPPLHSAVQLKKRSFQDRSRKSLVSVMLWRVQVWTCGPGVCRCCWSLAAVWETLRFLLGLCELRGLADNHSLARSLLRPGLTRPEEDVRAEEWGVQSRLQTALLSAQHHLDVPKLVIGGIFLHRSLTVQLPHWSTRPSLLCTTASSAVL